MAFVGKWLGLSRDRLYETGIRAFDQGSYEDAINYFSHCISESSDPATLRLARFYITESYVQLGQAALMRGALQHAEEFLKKALAEHPNYPDLHYYLAITQRRLGSRAEALASVARALAINSRFAKATLLQGLLWYEGGRVDDGLKRMRFATTLDPALNNGRFHCALSLHEDGNTDVAAGMFEAVISPAHDDRLASTSVADEASKEGRFEEAALEYASAVESEPSYPDLRCRFAYCLMKLERFDDAIEQLQAAVSLNPAYAQARFFLAQAYLAVGENGAARATLETILAYDAAFPDARALLQSLD